MAQVITGPVLRFSPDLNHMVKVPKSNKRVFYHNGYVTEEALEWLRQVRYAGKDWSWRKHLDGDTYSMIAFQDANDALLFKLTWGGV